MPSSKLPKNLVTLGDHLKKARLERKLLQKDVALFIGVSEDGYRFWEINKSEPVMRYKPKIISFLGYNPFTSTDNSLGGKVKEYRIKHGLTLEEVGKILQVNETTVGAWESGKSSPKPKTLEKVVELLTHKR